MRGDRIYRIYRVDWMDWMDGGKRKRQQAAAVQRRGWAAPQGGVWDGVGAWGVGDPFGLG